MTIEVLNVAETTEILRAAGMRMTPETLRLGLKQGVYPFGDYVDRNGNPVCCVYKKLLMQWMAERASNAEA